MSTNIEPYEVDDRGNVAQFYETAEYEIVATLDREYSEDENGQSIHSWDGGEDVTSWAVTHGYEEVKEAIQIQ